MRGDNTLPSGAFERSTTSFSKKRVSYSFLFATCHKVLSFDLFPGCDLASIECRSRDKRFGLQYGLAAGKYAISYNLCIRFIRDSSQFLMPPPPPPTIFGRNSGFMHRPGDRANQCTTAVAETSTCNSTGLGVMVKSGVIHPPAAAAAIVFSSGNTSWPPLVGIMLVGNVIAILCATSILVNNWSEKRHYPTSWGFRPIHDFISSYIKKEKAER